jgi:hypothetical protein
MRFRQWATKAKKVRKTDNEVEDVTLEGKLFQTRAATIEKALSPASVLVEGTRRAADDEERRR